MKQVRHNHILPSRPQTNDQPIREKKTHLICVKRFFQRVVLLNVDWVPEKNNSCSNLQVYYIEFVLVMRHTYIILISVS